MFPLLLAAYPVLTAYLWNIREIPLHVLWRPLFLALGAALALWFVFQVITRNSNRSALMTGLFIFLFSSYGQVHHALEEIPAYDAFRYQHWFLGAIGLALLVTGMIVISKKQPGGKLLRVVMIASSLLVLIPTTQIAWHLLKPEFKAEFPTDWYPPARVTQVQPDVYYFILDGYAREDLMLERTDYNNADFVDALTERGFYVADCSRTNYNNTILALTSTLNMQYYPALEELAASQGLTGKGTWRYLKPNIVMQTFQSMGYQSVAFDSGYYWSTLEDADIFLQPWEDAGDPPHMTPFEYLLLKGTPLVALYERKGGFESTARDDRLFPWRYHVAQQEYILDHAPDIAENDAATFAFIHVMIPHEPMVFSPEGIQTSPLYFGAGGNWPTTASAFTKAYVNGVRYLNPRMLEIVDRILEKSATPPIIILQGDHGFWTGTNLPVLNAYYLPGQAADALYPTISPVNSFRLIFDQYFGTNLGLLEDASYLVKDIETPVAEQLEGCR
jgi:energy-coupling factor transporter transmembrane protein EcfT